MAIFYQFLIAFTFSLSQILFIYLKGYFLSIEFTLYPYLISKGFVPYVNILDQHFPSLFFGAFSIPFFSAQSPLPLATLFAIVLIITNLLFFNYLRFKKVNNLFLWLGVFIVVMNYFSVNILWVETFIVFLLAIVLNISEVKTTTSYLLSGVIFSQIILLRPTLIISVICISIFLKLIKKEFLFGIIGGFVVSFCYLLSHGNMTQFLNLTFVFNASEYAKSSVIFPTKIQMLSILILFFYTLYSSFKSVSVLLFFATISSLLAAFPRSGLEHLQPFVLLVIISTSSVKNKSIILPTAVLLFFSFLLIFGLSKHRYGNYFYQPELYRLAGKISNIGTATMISKPVTPCGNKLLTHKKTA